MRFELKTAPANPATTLNEITTTCFINTGKHDTDISNRIESATLMIENYLGRKLINQSWYIYTTVQELTDRIAAYGYFTFGGLNVSSITEFLKYDLTNTSSVISSSDYRLLGNGSTKTNALVFNDTATIPTSNIRTVDGYRIEVVAGYGATSASIPDPVKISLEELIGYQATYKRVTSNSEEKPIPYKIMSRLLPYRSMETIVGG